MPQAAPTPTPAAALADTVHIRAAVAADLPAIVGLIRALAAYEELTHLLQVDEARLAPHLFGERPVAECLVATSLPTAPGLPAAAHTPGAAGEVGTLAADILKAASQATDAPVASLSGAACAEGGPAVVGFALFFPNYSTFLARPGIHLEDLFVLPAWRGRGIGQALLRHLAGLAVARGCGRLEWHVLDWNTPAIEFYSAMGATVLPDWRLCRVTGEALPRMAGTAG